MKRGGFVKWFVSLGVIVAVLCLFASSGMSCTTILIGKKLTADGAVIHGHNEDMGFTAVGRLWTVPEATHAAGATLDVPYTKIPQPGKTYRYWASGNAHATTGLGISKEKRPYDSVLVGMNEWGVTMSCNWMYSKEENLPGKGIRRYAIRQLILERAKTAREAVQVIADFIEKYGQADWGGLDYCLADPKEAWVVETTSKHWVAKQVKDDEFVVVANRFVVGKDYDLASKDLVDFAKKNGWYDPAKGPFSFRDAYGLPERMNSAYDKDRESRATDLLSGKKGFIVPEDLFLVLRDRYEGTSMYHKAIANMEHWEDVTDKLLIPRPIDTNLCQSSSVAQLRGDLPVEIGSVMWYAMVTPSFSGYFPVYAGATTVPESFSSVNSAYYPGSAWWTFRLLQKIGDASYDQVCPQILNFWTANHANLVHSKNALEEKALGLLKQGKKAEAIALINTFTYGQADQTLYHANRMLRLVQDQTKNVPIW